MSCKIDRVSEVKVSHFLKNQEFLEPQADLVQMGDSRFMTVNQMFQEIQAYKIFSIV